MKIKIEQNLHTIAKLLKSISINAYNSAVNYFSGA